MEQEPKVVIHAIVDRPDRDDVDQWRRQQPELISRAEALRRLLRRGLKAEQA